MAYGIVFINPVSYSASLMFDPPKHWNQVIEVFFHDMSSVFSLLRLGKHEFQLSNWQHSFRLAVTSLICWKCLVQIWEKRIILIFLLYFNQQNSGTVVPSEVFRTHHWWSPYFIRRYINCVFDIASFITYKSVRKIIHWVL